MQTLIGRAAREVFRREAIPATLRWWFVAEGMGEWFRLLRDELAPHLPGHDPSALVARIAAPMLSRRYDLLRTSSPALPDRGEEPRVVGLVMGSLYRVSSHVESGWIFEAAGGAPETLREHARAEAWISELTAEQRWVELSNHLGEMLIGFTESLPALLPRARAILGQICHDAGVRVGRKMKRAFGLERTAEAAIEVLRMAEYIFRVNEEHWTGKDGGASYLAGSACPWYTAPGWSGVHCGIFGQFQAGVASVFGLRYHLDTTIPKHGGSVCRVALRPLERAAGGADAVPIPVRLSRDGAAAGRGAG